MRTPLLFLAAGLAVAGCAQQPTQVDRQFGSAVQRARAAQVVDPDAPSRTNPQVQLDGAAARHAVERYEKSFEAPPPPQTLLNIGVGSDTGTR